MIPAAFDIEIAREVEGDDWSIYRPLGITCAALHMNGVTTVHHGGMGIKEYAPQMNPSVVRDLISEMWYNRDKWLIVTWNGLGFDFDILAEEAQDPEYAACCKELALNHVDMGFQMLCERGFMIGLNSAAHALGLQGKTEGMSGDKAPTMWAQGKFQQEKVLEYVGQDVVTTMQVYEEILKQKKVAWITKRGTPAKYPWEPEIREGRLLRVRECLELPLPDTSWMDEPWPREKFTGWTEVYT